MNRLPGHRLHSLSEMQLMGQSAQQKAVTKVTVLEKAVGELQRRQQETDANLLKVIDTLTMHQQALDKVIEKVEGLLQRDLIARIQCDLEKEDPAEVRAKIDDATLAPKRKPGRPKGSKNKPKAAPPAETVSAAPETAPGEAAE